MADELGYEPPLPRQRSGAVTAVAVFNFILGGLYALCGVIMMVAIGFLANLFGAAVQEAAQKSTDPQVAEAAKQGGGIVAMVAGFGAIFGLCILAVLALPLILAGVGVVKRRQWGRILTLVMAAILGLLGIAGFLTGLRSGAGNIIGSLILIGYGVFSYVVLLNSKNAAEFT